MRYLISIIVGILTSLIVFSIIAFLAISFNLHPYGDFLKVNVEIAKGNITAHNMDLFHSLARSILIVNIGIVFPIVGFITGIGVALVAKKKTVVLALISTLPITLLFFNVSIDFVAIVTSTFLFAILGTITMKYMKVRLAKLKNRDGAPV